MNLIRKQYEADNKRLDTVTIVLCAVLMVSLAALGALAVGPTLASGADDKTEPVTSVDEYNQVQQQFETHSTVGSEDVTIPPEAKWGDEEWGIIPEDGELEENEDQVEIGITAQDVGADPGFLDIADGEITSFRFDVKYDSDKLDLVDVDENSLISATAEDDLPGEWEYDIYGEDNEYIQLDWYLDIGFDDIIDQLFGDDDQDIDFLKFEGDELVTLTFEPTEEAEDGDFATVEVLSDRTAHNEHDEPIIWGGITGLSSYDTDNIFWGEGIVEIGPETNEPLIEGADRQFSLENTGGYIVFGEDGPPDENNLEEEALAEFEEGTIDITADLSRENDTWKAPKDSPGTEFDPVDLNEDYVGVSIEAFPSFTEPIQGDFDPSNDTMTMESAVEIDATGDEFDFEFDSTKGESGELSGEADFSEIDVDSPEESEDGTVTLVSNEFTVEEQDVGADDQANLADGDDWIADEEGKNYIVFEFDLEDIEEFAGDAGTIEGEVAEGGDAIENARVKTSGSDDEVTVKTDSDGKFEIGPLDPDSYTVSYDAQGYESTENQVTIDGPGIKDESVELEAKDANFDVEIDDISDEIEEGDNLSVVADIENTKGGVDEQDIQLIVDGEKKDSETIELAEEIDYDFDGEDATPLEPKETIDLKWETDGADTGEYDIEIKSADSSQTETITITDEIDIDAALDAELEEGTLSVGDIVVQLPSEETEERPLRVDGEITDDEWDADSGEISFPEFNDDALGSANPDVPRGFDGTVDRDGDEIQGLSLTGGVEVVTDDQELEFSIDATSDESGEMAGSVDGNTVELVDNEFTIDGLAEEPGDAELSLKMNVEIDEDADGAEGDLEGVVTDEEDNYIEGATVSVEGATSEDTTNDDGEYELTGVDTGEQTVFVEASEIEDDSVTVDVEEDTTTDKDITVEAADAEFEPIAEGDSAVAEDPLEIGATIQNTGGGTGETDIQLTVKHENGDELLSETFTETIEGDDSIDLSEEIETDEELIGEGTVTVEVDDATDDSTIEVEEPITDDPDAFIEMTNTGEGYISFDEDNEDDAIEEGLQFPEEEIVIEGEVFDDRWQATGVQFPELDAGAAEAGVEFSDVGGEIDTDSGEMTLGGDLAVEVLDFDGDPFEFEIDATTGESGELSGDDSLSDDGGSIVVVDNEYTINDETGGPADNILGLPLTDSGLAWIELHLDAEIEDADETGPSGNIEGIVENEDGEPVEDATVDVVDEIEEDTTDEAGEYEIERIDSGSYEVAVDADGYGEKTASVEVSEDDTTEQSFTLEAGEPEFDAEDVEVQRESSGTVITSTTITNTGETSGTEEFALSFDDEETTKEVDLEPGEEETVTAEWDAVDDDASTASTSLSAGGEELYASDDVEVDDSDDAENAILIEGEGGYVGFSQATEDDAEADGIEITGFAISGEIEDDGSFEAEDVSFDNLEEPSTGTEATVSSDGFEGEINTETGELEMTGDLVANIEDFGEQFDFEVTLTTDSSGEMSGDVSFDSEEEAGEATLVDNEFSVDGTGEDAIDSVLGLPSESGESWLALEADISLTTADEAETTGEDDDSEEDSATEQDDESNGTFLTAFGQLVGFIGLLAGVVTMGLGVASRFISAIDPDS